MPELADDGIGSDVGNGLFGNVCFVRLLEDDEDLPLRSASSSSPSDESFVYRGLLECKVAIQYYEKTLV